MKIYFLIVTVKEFVFAEWNQSLCYSTEIEHDIDMEPKWQLIASACISRAPLITPSMNKVEKKFDNVSTIFVLLKIELEFLCSF